MKEYVQVPAAEPQEPYALTATRESATLLCLSRSTDSMSLVLLLSLSTTFSYLTWSVAISSVVTVLTVILTL